MGIGKEMNNEERRIELQRAENRQDFQNLFPRQGIHYFEAK